MRLLHAARLVDAARRRSVLLKLASAFASAHAPPPAAGAAPPISSSDQLVLAAALLREHGGSLEPSVHKSRRRDVWQGATPGAPMPSGITFVRQFPAVFSVEWGVRRLAGDAVTEFERYAKKIRLNADAPVQLLERATAASADPAVYGPLIERELARAGGYLPLRALTVRLQLAALAAGVRLPPAGVNWFILHPSPHYARLRPLWSSRVQEDGYLFNEGCMFVEQGVVEFEAAELRKLAASLGAPPPPQQQQQQQQQPPTQPADGASRQQRG